VSSLIALPSAQYEALLHSLGPARLKHFIHRAVDSASVWSLRDARGWLILPDERGTPAFPVWPHPEYALAFAAEDWQEFTPDQIDVHEFLEKWLPDLNARGMPLAVFPTPSMKAVWIRPDEIRRQLRQELEKYGESDDCC
jgi:hypothetical protein